MRLCSLILIEFFYCTNTKAQLPVTIPWSSSLNVTFEKGSSHPPGSLPAGYTDFAYTTNSTPLAGYYNIIYSTHDAGHIYYGPLPLSNTALGYKMIACYDGLFTGKILYKDTIRNLCDNAKFLFWAGINNVNPTSCLHPNLTFSVETATGLVIETFQTGKIGGPLGEDHFSSYYGYYDPAKPPPIRYYGGVFQLPAGLNEIVVKIITNPSSSANPRCSAIFEIDNIILMPIGPEITISSPKHPGGWITASCFQGDVPLELNAEIQTGYRDFGNGAYVFQSYANPAFQWQQSLDEGYTWMDIPGETNINISHIFNIPDTFWMRLRVSEAEVIGNPNCRNVSNVFKVYIDGLPTDFSLTSNSPVCTDGDLKLDVSGGATYNTYGPNGFYDDSPFPHIYYPHLSDSGWYYSEIISFGGCKGTDSEYVRITGPNLSVSPGKTICYGEMVRLQATGGGTYNWTPAEGLNNTTTASPVASPVKTTKYEVKVSDGSGCSAYGNVTITLRNTLLKAIMNGPDVACPSDAVLFKDTSIGQIASWRWNFGNGNTSNLQKPDVQYYPVTNSTDFPVTLTITDTAGCVQTARTFIKSVNNCLVAVPSAFTPNNDGMNDFLYPLNAYKATDITFKVFNRLGYLVFETNDWTKKWNGTAGGVPQPSGVYVWLLTYKDDSQKQVSLKGATMLIR